MSKVIERPTQEELERLYHDERLTLEQIGKKYDVTGSSVRKWFKKKGIKIRSKSESKLPATFKTPSNEELKELYENQGLSAEDIAERLGCSDRKVYDLLSEAGVRRKQIHRAKFFMDMDEERLIEYISKNHSGKSITQLQEEDNRAYVTVRKKGLLTELVERRILVRKENEKNYWKNWENVRDKLEEITEKIGHFPQGNELRELEYSSLDLAISKYHGGWNRVRQTMGADIKRLQNGIWKNLDYALEQASLIMKRHNFEELPGDRILRKLGYSSLARAIHVYHGNISVFRTKLNEYLGRETEESTSLLEKYLGEVKDG